MGGSFHMRHLAFAAGALLCAAAGATETSEPIPALSAFFLGLRSGVPVHLTPMALAALQAYGWPGNVRELRHVLDYAASMCRTSSILLSHLPPHIASIVTSTSEAPSSGELDAAVGRWLDQQLSSQEEPPGYDALLDHLEAVTLRHLMMRYDYKPTHLAAELRMNRATLRQKLRRAGLSDLP